MKGAGTNTGVGVIPALGSWYMNGEGEKPLTLAPAAATKAWVRDGSEVGAVDDDVRDA